MPPPVCSKCRFSLAIEGDLWCLGCAGWEAIGRELGGHWDIGGAKVLANDLVLNCSRQVRALRSLGAGISTGGARSVEAGQSRASVAPPPPAPGRDQGDRDTRTRSELPRQRATFNLPRPPSPPRRAKEEQVTEPLSEEEEEEEEEDEEGDNPEVRGAEPKRKPPGPDPSPRRERQHSSRRSHRSAGHSRAERSRSRRRDRTRGSHTRQSKPRRRTKRAGRKHQRLKRLAEDPLLRVHRKAGPGLLELLSVSQGRHALEQSV